LNRRASVKKPHTTSTTGTITRTRVLRQPTNGGNWMLAVSPCRMSGQLPRCVAAQKNIAFWKRIGALRVFRHPALRWCFVRREVR
jgi:hypothetical protein